MSNNIEPKPRRFLSRRQQAKRYSKSLKTISRWGQDPRMAMPQEYVFNGLPHREETELEIWERGRVAANPARDTRKPSAENSTTTAI